ncbi:hypothetical protein B0H14DRAFT_3534119 [Mycena olivaceomarginata]|nr:hypothetical protein B0H14DRAFT_3534119 [Mycena olivaceomarginata]
MQAFATPDIRRKADFSDGKLGTLSYKLYAALIRGPDAAATTLNPEKGAIQKNDNMERIHGIDHMEPGAIAGACVLTIWGKSADKCLHAIGDHTGIDYKARFDEYLDLLTSGLRNKVPSILRVFSEWDHTLFPGSEASHGDPQRKQCRAKSDGYRRAMEAMKAEMKDGDGGEGGGDASSSKGGKKRARNAEEDGGRRWG